MQTIMLIVSASCDFCSLNGSVGMSLIKTGRWVAHQQSVKNTLMRERIYKCYVDCLMKKYVEQEHHKC